MVRVTQNLQCLINHKCDPMPYAFSENEIKALVFFSCPQVFFHICIEFAKPIRLLPMIIAHFNQMFTFYNGNHIRMP